MESEMEITGIEEPVWLQNIPINQRMGRCYELTGKFVTHGNFDWSAVYGVLIPDRGRHAGQNYEHAWLERDAMVYDLVINMVATRNAYYRLYQVEVISRLSDNDLFKFTTEHGIWPSCDDVRSFALGTLEERELTTTGTSR